MRKMDLGAAVLNDGQRGPDQVHHVLPVETFADTLGEMGVGNVSHTLQSIQLRSVDVGHPRRRSLHLVPHKVQCTL